MITIMLLIIDFICVHAFNKRIVYTCWYLLLATTCIQAAFISDNPYDANRA